MQQTISLVIPVYAAEAYLMRLCEAIERYRLRLKERGAPVELTEAIFVIDDAIDGSSAVLDGLAKQHDWVTTLTLSRNFGQHSATIAGILHSSGDWVATLDEDLQHDPGRLSNMFAALLEADADIAYAKPAAYVHGSVFRDSFSRWYKQAIAAMTGMDEVVDFNSFRLMRGNIARAASQSAAHQIYFDVALVWYTTRIAYVAMDLVDERHQRTGTSGYSPMKLLAHAKRMAMTSHIRALNYVALAGVAALVLSFAYLTYIVIVTLLVSNVEPIRGWPSQMVVSLAFGGMTLFVLSFIVEYLAFLVAKANGRPKFFVIDRSRDEELRSFFLT